MQWQRNEEKSGQLLLAAGSSLHQSGYENVTWVLAYCLCCTCIVLSALFQRSSCSFLPFCKFSVGVVS